MWLAAYLYYAEPFEPLLKQFVKPLVDDVIKLPGVTQFFFIRYWHKGPHVRLRFKGQQETLEEVKNNLKKGFEEYTRDNPSSRKEPGWLSDLSEENKWRSNNSICFIPYEPEIARYGGDEAIEIAEQHFQHSSEAILNIISESDEWDYEQALGTAVQLHLSFAHALDMDTKEAKLFFDYIFVSWFPRAIAKNRSGLSQPKLAQMKKATLEAFEKGFEKQKNVLVPFCQNFWEVIHNERIPGGLEDWIECTKEINQKLLNCQQGGNLTPPDWYISKEKWNIPVKNRERWKIFQSYVHMTNNRLGILNRDEGFLGYLIRESFKN